MTESNKVPVPTSMLEYDAEPLPILSYAEAVRMRPGMYIGDVAVPGLHHLFKEIIDNSIDEVMAGYCSQITVTLGKDRSLTVEDNGRGLSVVIEAAGNSFAERVMTDGNTHCLRSGYRCSGGLHGVGALCVNALSEWMETTVRHDGKIYQMRFSRGVPVSPLEVIGECAPDERGTTQQWLADRDIFKLALTDAGELDYRPERLSSRMREMAFLNREVSITFVDALNDAAPVVFHYPQGIAAYVAWLNEGEEVLHAPIYLEADYGDLQIMVALQYKRSNQETIRSFVNNWPLTEGGTHITGFKAALTRVINRYARQHGSLTGANFSGDAVRAGLIAIVSLRMTNPMCSSADRSRLLNPESEGAVGGVVGDKLTAYFESNPEVACAIIGSRKK